MRLLRLLPGIGNTIAQKIFRIFQNEQAVRLTKDNIKLKKLIPEKSLEHWNSLLEIFQEMLREKQTPSQMISILFTNFYRDFLFNSFENAMQRETDIHYLQEFAENYEGLDSFLNELSLVGSSIITEHDTNKLDNTDILTLN